MRRPRTVVARLVVSGLLLLALFRFGGVAIGDLVGVFRSARTGPLVGAAAIYCIAGTVLRALRWRILIEDLGHRLGLRRCTEIFLIGTTFNQVLPTGIGGDVVRTVLLGREGLGSARAASTVLVERAAGMLALLGVGVLMVAWAGPGLPPAVRLLLMGAAIAGFVGAGLLRRGEVFRSRLANAPVVGAVARHAGVTRFVGSFAEYSPGAIWWGFVLSVMFAVVLIVTNRLLGLALGAPDVSWTVWGIVVPLIALSLLVPSIAGLGVREWTYVGLLAALADPPVGAAVATAVSLAFHGLNLLLAVAGGVILAALGRNRIALDDAVGADERGSGTPPEG